MHVSEDKSTREDEMALRPNRLFPGRSDQLTSLEKLQITASAILDTEMDRSCNLEALHGRPASQDVG